MHKLDPIDARASALRSILEWHVAHGDTVRNESDTRLKLINRVMLEVLMWPPEQIQTEETEGNTRLDYRYTESGLSRAVIEAKRSSVDFELKPERSGQAFILSGSAFGINARFAIKQVIQYCALQGAELGCCTNGLQWIVFRANRLGDGKPILNGKGYIFASLCDIELHLDKFLDLLSRESIQTLRYRAILNEAEGIAVRDFTFFEPVRHRASRQILQVSDFARNFDSIMESFFRRLKGDSDEEMIRKCFVVSKDSDNAERKISRIAETIVGRVRNLDTDTGEQLVSLIKLVQQSHKNRFVLLVGNKGAGKSTFIDRFFTQVLASEIRTNLAVVRVDLALCDGDPANTHHWLNKQLLEETEKSVYGEEGPDYDETIGAMFWRDMKRWKNVTKKHLFETNRQRFMDEFGSYVEKVRQDDPHDYVKRLIGNIVRSRKKVPCLVFDNTDHHSIQFQEGVFQYARSIYEDELCMVIMPITDRTSWQLSREGVLESFESESLYLPVPDTFRVVERRIKYLSEKIDEAKANNSIRYFFQRGIQLEISNLEGFVHALNRIFIESKIASQWMGSLVNYDVRRLLELVRDVIESPHIDLESLFSAYITKSPRSIPQWKLKKALILGRYDIHPTGEHHYVKNIFDTGDEVPMSPLLQARIMRFLKDAAPERASDSFAFVPIPRLLDYFAAMGIGRNCIMSALDRLLAWGLVLNYDPTVIDSESAVRVEIAPAGITHLDWAISDHDYLKSMAQVTPFRSEQMYRAAYDACHQKPFGWAKLIDIFTRYLIHEDSQWVDIPNHAAYAGQSEIHSILMTLSKRATRVSSREPRRHRVL